MPRRARGVALQAFEPGFSLTEFMVVRAGRDGVFEFRLIGDFYPRGHLGDLSVKEGRGLSLAGAAGSLERLEVAPA